MYHHPFHTQRQRTVYKRLIFAIGVSDILQSFGLLIGPFTAPVIGVTSHLWAAGNEASCVFDGLVFTFGATWVPISSAALSIYYLMQTP